MALVLKNLSVRIENKTILQNINIEIPDNKFVGIIGLNGTGKSTLLKCVYGIYPYSGEIFFNDVNLNKLKLKERAQKMAVLVQENNIDFDFKVKDMVLMGRMPYKKLLEDDNEEDFQIVNKALSYVNMLDFKDRYFSTLSGGEKQRIMIARVLAQNTKFIVLDEPTNHLDINNQFQFFELIKNMKFTVLSVLHDLNMAARFCDYIYLVSDSSICASGKPKEVLTQNVLRDIFGMYAIVHNVSEDKIYIEYIKSCEK